MARQRDNFAKATGAGKYKGRNPTAMAKAEEVALLKVQGGRCNSNREATGHRAGVGVPDPVEFGVIGKRFPARGNVSRRAPDGTSDKPNAIPLRVPRIHKTASGG